MTTPAAGAPSGEDSEALPPGGEAASAPAPADGAGAAPAALPRTLRYPDISQYQGDIDLAGAEAVCARASEGARIADPWYAASKAKAAKLGVYFFAYHFLESLSSAAAQAAYCHAITGSVPLMVDVEPVKNSDGSYFSRPTARKAAAFIRAYRKLGGICWLVYLPEWYYADLGSPSLQPLISLGALLVSSSYPAGGYSPDGPGWAPYGGMTPVIWQYTDSAVLNGTRCDHNAFRRSPSAPGGALAQLKSVVSTGRLPSPPPPPPPPPPSPEEEPPLMMLRNGANAQTVDTMAAGFAKGVFYGCDNTYLKLAPVRLRVAVHSASKGWTQVEHVTVPPSGTLAVAFREADVDMTAVTRESGTDGDRASVGYSLLPAS